MARFRLTFVLAAIAALSALPARAGEYTNYIGMKFADIPPGYFVMGSCKENLPGLAPRCRPDADASENETPRHTVTFRRGIQIGAYEVTVAQFKQFIAATDRNDLLSDDFRQSNRFGDDAPVVMVSWSDAKDFINWLNKTKPTGDRGIYRLPTEAEWEYAARAGTQTRYPWGDSAGRGNANCDGCGSNWDNHRPSPVGSFAPNAWGLYDMVGNAAEWVEDCWHDSYNGAPSDGSNPWTNSQCAGPVIRGGSWSEDSWAARTSARDSNSVDFRNFDTGFRLVRTTRP